MKLLSALAGLCAPVFAVSSAHTLWSQRAYGAGGASIKWTDSVVLSTGRVVACATEYGAKSTLLLQAWEPDGTVAWVYRFPDAGDQYYEKAAVLATDGSNVFAVGTRSASPTSDDDEVFALKLNSFGLLLQTEQFGANPYGYDEVVCGAAITAFGELFVTGYSKPAIVTTHEGWVAKLDNTFRYDELTPLNYETRVTPGKPFPLPDGRVLVPSEGDLVGGFSYRTRLSRINSLGVEDAAYQVANTTGTVQPVARTSAGQIFFLVQDGGGFRVSKLTPDLALLGTTVVNDHFYNRGSILWSDAAQALYVCSDRYTEDLLDMRKYTVNGQLVWSDTPANVTNHLGDYMLKADRFGNPVVVSNEIRDNGNVNFVAWCWDSRGLRQWKNAFTNTETSDDIPSSFTLDDKLRLIAVGRAENPADPHNDYKGAIWRTSQFFHRTPDNLTMRLGYAVAGSLADLAEPDGVSQTLGNDSMVFGLTSAIVADYETNFPIEIVDPATTSLEVRLDMSCNASSGYVALMMYDWTVNTWRFVWDGTLSNLPNTQVANISSPQRYVRPGSRQVRTRIITAPLRRPLVPFRVFVDSVEVRSDT
ncbi:MAG: hypothetical protein JSS65_00535 [Armatimonadetes bacterium]|nr:hypothetical protein [Armatimonadota bacterium]